MMIVDLIVGIIASLIASGIVGFLGNKAISKHSDNTIMKIYVLFLSAFAFIVCAMLSVILNDSFLERILKMNEANILKFYHNCINNFVWLFGILFLVTIAVIIIEAFNRGANRDHKQDMDRYKKLK